MTNSNQPSSGSGNFLSLRDLTKTYRNLTTVKALNLDVRQGELVALLGPSGCGKTTTLRMIAGLTDVSGGGVHLAGKDITSLPVHQRRIGLVFQSYALFPHMTVAENIAFGLKMQKKGGSEIETSVATAVAQVRLNGLEDRKPKQLSGGQQQRVALARALVTNPELLLLDEPLSNLDAKLRDQLRQEVRDVQQRHGTTSLFVTHDQSEALSMCDRVAVMNNGVIEQLATPEDIYERPATPFVASFVGRTNRIAGTSQGDGWLLLDGGRIRGNRSLAGAATIMVRPHRIAISPATGTAPTADNILNGSVTRVTYVGDMIQYQVTSGPLELQVETATTEADFHFGLGSAVKLAWSAADTMVFEGEQ